MKNVQYKCSGDGPLQDYQFSLKPWHCLLNTVVPQLDSNPLSPWLFKFYQIKKNKNHKNANRTM